MTQPSKKSAKGNGKIQKRRVVVEKQAGEIKNKALVSALDAANMGIWEWNIQTNKITWSDQTYHHFGFVKPFPPVTFELYTSLIHPDDRPLLQERLQQTLQTNQEYHIEHRIVQPEGKIIWLEAAGRLLYRKNVPYKLTGTVWDVTELKKSKSRLQSLDQLFSALSFSIHELFLNSDWSKAIATGLQKIGEATLVDRVYLFQNDLNSTQGKTQTTSQRFEWNSGVAEPQIDNPELQELPGSEIEPSWSILSQNQPFFHVVREMEATNFKRILQDENILSILLFPIFVRNAFWGFIGFDECKYERQWTEVEFSVLRSFSTSIASALERKLSESEKEDWKIRYELVSAASGQVIYDYNVGTGNIVWGGNVAEVLGYTEAEMGDINLWGERIHEQDRARAFELLEKAEAGLLRYDVEYRFQHKNKNFVTIYDRGFFMTNAEDGGKRMLGMMSDITHRKVAEEALRESEQRFRILQEASFGGIGLHDKGLIIDCNQGLSDLTGYSYSELIGMDGLLLIPEEYRSMVRERILNNHDKAYDLEGLRKDGTRYFLEVHGKNIPYKGDTIRVTEFRDITERKTIEQQIVEQNAKLTAIAEDMRRKNEQLEEFTQIVSHNLRSPVGNIITLLEFYENAKSTQEASEYFELLKEASHKTLTTLHELHEVLKIKQEKKIDRQQLSFAEVFQSVKLMLHANIIQNDATIETDFDMAPALLYPRIYLESIFLNLISNALKYRKLETAPKIHLRTYQKADKTFLECTDNGLGIDLVKYGHQVFKMRKTFHTHPESRGIGLFLIKNQIEAMGGEIVLNSEPNKGSTFTVIFDNFATKHE